MALPQRYRTAPGTYGLCLRLSSPWKKEYIDRLPLSQIAELELNTAWGWPSSDLHFVDVFPNLVSLFLLDYDRTDDGKVQELSKLKRLTLQTWARNPLSLSKLTQLEMLGIEDHRRLRQLSLCRELTSIRISNTSPGTLFEALTLPKLRSLQFYGQWPKNYLLSGPLPKLSNFEIGFSRGLTTLDGFDRLTGLESLSIESTKTFHCIEPLRRLTKLKSLALNDCGRIDSFDAIRNHEKLEYLYFWGSTVVEDGQLNWIKDLPRLRSVTFANRRHYDCTREEIIETLKQEGRYDDPNRFLINAEEEGESGLN